jgi:uncharacterized membrane protein HdeD (DUF308 family)
LLILGGIAILGNAVLATMFSVLLIGWTTLISGVVLAVGAFFKFKSGGFWSAALSGAVLAVLGLFILRNPLIGALSLTLLAGALFLVTGVTRIVVSSHFPEVRGALIVSGIVSLALGMFVLFNLVEATLTLLGVLLGVQILVEGVTLLVAGRVRAVPSARS